MSKSHIGLSNTEKGVYALFIFKNLVSLESKITKSIQNAEIYNEEECAALCKLHSLVRSAFYRVKDLVVTDTDITAFSRYPPIRASTKSIEPKIIVGSWLNNLTSDLNNMDIPRSPGENAAIQKLAMIGSKLKKHGAPKN